jgi:hypothetical protein
MEIGELVALALDDPAQIVRHARAGLQIVGHADRARLPPNFHHHHGR